MRFRKLRIAWSVGCGVLCVLLIVMWVRSYWWADSYTIQINQTWFGCSDLRGSIVFNCFNATKRTDLKGGYSWGTASRQRLDAGISKHFFGFVFKRVTDGAAIVLPSWFLITVSVGCAIAP